MSNNSYSENKVCTSLWYIFGPVVRNGVIGVLPVATYVGLWVADLHNANKQLIDSSIYYYANEKYFY